MTSLSTVRVTMVGGAGFTSNRGIFTQPRVVRLGRLTRRLPRTRRSVDLPWTRPLESSRFHANSTFFHLIHFLCTPKVITVRSDFVSATWSVPLGIVGQVAFSDQAAVLVVQNIFTDAIVCFRLVLEEPRPKIHSLFHGGVREDKV